MTLSSERSGFQANVEKLFPDLGLLLAKHNVADVPFSVNLGIDLQSLFVDGGTWSCRWDAASKNFVCNSTPPQTTQLPAIVVEAKLVEIFPDAEGASLRQLLEQKQIADPFSVDFSGGTSSARMATTQLQASTSSTTSALIQCCTNKVGTVRCPCPP